MIMSSGPVAMGVNVNGLMMMRQHQQQQQLQIQLHSQSSNSSTISSNSNHQQHHNHQNQQNQNQNQTTQSQSQLDIEFDGTTVLCRVCGDKASGFHYGVHSCEGCKGFFRRSIQQKIQYRPCTKNQQCSILRVNRNRCQYCRLKKCISVGMSRDAVRFGRVPKREKAKILAAMQQCHVAKSAERALTQELEDLTALKDTVVTAHMETCEFTRSRVDQMFAQNDKKSPIKLEPGVDQQTFENESCPESFKFPKTSSSTPQQPFLLLACPLNPYQNMKQQTEVDDGEVGPGEEGKKGEGGTDFSERFSPAIRGVVEFAKRLPGFNLLSQDDQVTLLKAGVFEVLLVRFSCMFRKERMMCVNGQVVHHDRPPGHQQGSGGGQSEGQNGRFLLDSMFKFAEQFNLIGLIDDQLALFCAIVILAPDRPGLRNIDLVQKLNSALRNCIIILNNSNNGSSASHLNSIQLLQELDKKIPDLRTLNTLHSEKLVAFKMNQENAQNAQNGENFSYSNSTTNILNQVIMKRFEVKKEILEEDDDDYESSIMDDDRSYVTDREDQDLDDSASLSGRSIHGEERHQSQVVSGRKLKYFGHHGSSVMISPPSTPLSVCSTYSNHSILSAPPSPLSQNSLVYSSICNYNKQDTLQLIAQQQRRRSSSNSNYSNSSSASSTCSNSNYFSSSQTTGSVQLQGQDLSSGSSRSIPSSPSSVNSNYSSIDSGVESLSSGSPSSRKRKLYNMMGSEFYDKRSKKYDHESDDHGSVKSANDHDDLDHAQFEIDQQQGHHHQQIQVEEAMPVLKRALQAPPLFSSASANSSKSTAQQQNLKMIEDLLYNSHQQQQQQQQNGESNGTQQSNGEFVRHKKFRYYNVNSNSSESSTKSEKSSKSEQMPSPTEPNNHQQQPQPPQQNNGPKSILVETLTSGSKVSNGHGQSNYNSIGNCFYSGNNLRVSDILSTNPTTNSTTAQQQQQQNSQFKMPQSSPHHQTSPRPPTSQGISPNSHQLTRKLLSQGPPSQNESKLSQLLLAEAIHGPKQNDDKMGFLSRLKFEQASDLIHSVVMSAPNARNGHHGPPAPPPPLPSQQSANEVDGKIKMLLNSNSTPLNLVTNKNFK